MKSLNLLNMTIEQEPLTQEQIDQFDAARDVHNRWIDYDLIFQLSYKRDKEITRHGCTTFMPRTTMLKDLCTIHMGAGRQNGKTAWAIKQVLNGHAVIISRDKNLRDATLKTLNEEFAKTPAGIRAIGEERDGKKVINITLDAEDPNPAMTVNFVLAQYKLANQRNVYTALDLQSMDTDIDVIDTHFGHVKLIIIDDASHNSKLPEIYNWLADNISPKQEITIVQLG